MATRTLTQLITDVRTLANVLGSNFVSDTNITDWINNAVGELYDLVISTFEHYYVKQFNFTLAGGFSGNSQSLAALTGGFYKDNTLEFNPGTSTRRIVRRLGAFNERDNAVALSYDILDTPNTLYVYPPESSNGNYQLLYTPDAPILATNSPGPQVDLDATLGRWYQYVVKRATIDLYRKRGKTDEAAMLAGSDDNPQPGTLAHERKRVLTMAHNKVEGPQQVPMPQPRGTSFWKFDDTP